MSVSSSNLASIGYENSTLEVEFLKGGIYQYFNLPSIVYQELMQANSHGTYFSEYIRKSYSYLRIS